MRANDLIVDEKLAAFYYARDVFLGDENHQDMAEGLRLMRLCSDNEEARWLCDIFPNGAPKTNREACAAILAAGERQSYAAYVRSLYYAATVAPDSGVHFLVKSEDIIYMSAALGYGCAQGWCAANISNPDVPNFNLKMALAASSSFDRRGLFELGRCYSKEPDVDYIKASSAYLASARLGYGDAMVWYGAENFHGRDPELYKWFGAALRYGTSLLYFISDTVRELEGNLSAELRYQIGKMFKEINSEIFPVWDRTKTEADFVKFYDDQNEKAKQAVVSWALCARRGNLVHKDIVRVIGKCVWDLRCDADYALEKSEN